MNDEKKISLKLSFAIFVCLIGIPYAARLFIEILGRIHIPFVVTALLPVFLICFIVVLISFIPMTLLLLPLEEINPGVDLLDTAGYLQYEPTLLGYIVYAVVICLAILFGNLYVWYGDRVAEKIGRMSTQLFSCAYIKAYAFALIAIDILSFLVLVALELIGIREGILVSTITWISAIGFLLLIPTGILFLIKYLKRR